MAFSSSSAPSSGLTLGRLVRSTRHFLDIGFPWGSISQITHTRIFTAKAEFHSGYPIVAPICTNEALKQKPAGYYEQGAIYTYLPCNLRLILPSEAEHIWVSALGKCRGAPGAAQNRQLHIGLWVGVPRPSKCPLVRLSGVQTSQLHKNSS